MPRFGRRPGTTRSTGSPRRSRARRPRTAATPSACFGGGGLTNEKAYQLGKFARVALRTPQHRLQRPVLHVVGRRGRHPRVRDRPRPAVPARRHRRRPTCSSSSAATRPTRCRPRCSSSTRAASAAPGTSWSTRGAPPPPSARTPAPAAGARHRPRAGQRPAAHRDPGGPGRRGVRRRAHQRVRRRAPGRARLLAGPGRADHRRRRRPTSTTVVRSLAAAPTAMILTARGAEQHASGTDTAQAFINLALALGLPGRPGSGYGTLTGQGNGQGGREHGQKADQLPGYRSLDDPAARAHVAAVWGVDPDELPGPGRRRLRAARPAGHRRRRAGAAGAARPTSVVCAPGRAPGRAAARARWTSSSSPTSSCPRPRSSPTSCCPPRSGPRRSGTMTNLEGRVLLRRKAARPAGRACAPTCRCWRGLADRLGRGQYFSDRPGGGLRRAAPGQRRRHRRLRRHHLRADRRRARASSGRARPRTTPARRGCSPTASPPPTAGRASSRVDAPARRRAARRATTRTCSPPAGCCAQYQSGTQTRRSPTPRRGRARARTSSCTRTWPACSASPSGDLVRAVHPRAARPCSTPASTAGIRPDTVFVPFHWGGAACVNALSTTRSTRRRGCRSSRSARSPSAARRPTAVAAARAEPAAAAAPGRRHRT